MADPFTGEIRIFAGNFAPYNWAFCNGQTVQIQQNSVLYGIIGTQYGGNGTTNFLLPNLNGKAPLHQGTGVGLTTRVVGDDEGATTVMLNSTTIPNHTHIPQALAIKGTSTDPTSNVWAENVVSGRTIDIPQPLYSGTSSSTTMNPTALSPVGGSQPHNNMQPYLPMNFIICLYGEFPPHP
jgi:microcystin-dependent protein